MKCRSCGGIVTDKILDLGHQPPSNFYLSSEDLVSPEVYYPLSLIFCRNCSLVQTKDYHLSEDLFLKDYAYFSSTSTSFVRHARNFSMEIIDRLKLDKESFVIELASNDGYLLRNFVAEGIPCLGVEPTESTAVAASSIGIPTLKKFFGSKVAEEIRNSHKLADLIIANNVYAHVPDVNDFTLGISKILNDEGVLSVEFPYVKHIIESGIFDTVYHEHFSYFSLKSFNTLVDKFGLRVFSVEEISTHGGSLRVSVCHKNARYQTHESVSQLIKDEEEKSMDELEYYLGLQGKTVSIKNNFNRFLLEAKMAGDLVLGYGAAAKGNTLLNYAGVKPDLLSCVCDAAPSKQGKFLPGTHIPICGPDVLYEMQPRFVVVLPWNIIDEVLDQFAKLRSNGMSFVTAIPDLKFWK